VIELYQEKKVGDTLMGKRGEMKKKGSAGGITEINNFEARKRESGES